MNRDDGSRRAESKQEKLRIVPREVHVRRLDVRPLISECLVIDQKRFTSSLPRFVRNQTMHAVAALEHPQRGLNLKNGRDNEARFVHCQWT